MVCQKWMVIVSFKYNHPLINMISSPPYVLFQYDTIVGSDGKMYDDGIQLTQDGLYRFAEYIRRAENGPLNLHSFYLLLFVNLGAFCMALLTQPHAEERMRGTVISQKWPFRNYCTVTLQAVWKHMRSSLHLTLEKQSYLISQSLRQFLKVY